MEQKFVAAWAQARAQAVALGVRMRPIADSDALNTAKRCLSSHRESEGFFALADKGQLQLSLEALAVRKEFTSLFTDEQANTALSRLLEAGYSF